MRGAAQALRLLAAVAQVPPDLTNQRRRNGGTAAAIAHDMAAIFALVFVPAVAAVLFMLGDIHGHFSVASIAATGIFLALLVGLLTGLFRLARQWDESTH